MKIKLCKLTSYLITGTLLLTSHAAYSASAASAAASNVIISTLENKKPYLSYCFQLLKLQCATEGSSPAPGTLAIKVNEQDGIESVTNLANMRCAMTFRNDDFVPGQLKGKTIVEAMRPLQSRSGSYDCNSDVVLTDIVISPNLMYKPTTGESIPSLIAAGYAPPTFFTPDPKGQQLSPS